MAVGQGPGKPLKRKRKRPTSDHPETDSPSEPAPESPTAPTPDAPAAPALPPASGGYRSQEVLVLGMSNAALIARDGSFTVRELQHVLLAPATLPPTARGPLVHFVRTRKLVRAIFTTARTAEEVAAAGTVQVDGRPYPIRLHRPPEEGPPSERLCFFGIPPDVAGKTLAEIITQQLGEGKAKTWSRFLVADTGVGVIHFDSVESAALARGRLHGLGLATPGSGAVLRLWARYDAAARGRWMHQSGEVVEHSNPLVARKWRKGLKEESRPVEETTVAAPPVVSQGVQERLAALRAELASAKETLQQLEQQVQEQEAVAVSGPLGSGTAALQPPLPPRKRPKAAAPSPGVA